MTRRGRRAGAAAAVLALLAVTGLGYGRLTRHTPVTEAEAVERFEAELEQERRAAGPPAPSPAAAGAAAAAAAGAPSAGARAPGPQPPAAEGGTPTSAPEAATPADATPADAAPVARLRPPQGLYAYATQGEEGIGVFTRDFEPESFRTIVHRRDGGWSDHHVFSEQRESWNTFSLSGQRRLVHSQRNRVVIPPVTKDVTLTFTPPLDSTLLPWRVGRTWGGPIRGRASGSDNGEVTGTLRGQTRALTSLRVGGTDVRTWVDRLELDLRGAVEGTVDVTRWLAPDSGLTVREEYEATVQLGGGITYRAQWTVQLRSLQPVR